MSFTVHLPAASVVKDSSGGGASVCSFRLSCNTLTVTWKSSSLTDIWKNERSKFTKIIILMCMTFTLAWYVTELKLNFESVSYANHTFHNSCISILTEENEAIKHWGKINELTRRLKPNRKAPTPQSSQLDIYCYICKQTSICTIIAPPGKPIVFKKTVFRM